MDVPHARRAAGAIAVATTGTASALLAGFGDVLAVQRVGDRAADILKGSKRADQLRGKGGDDSLTGGAGNDRLYGGPGIDELSGGAGRDRLYAVDGEADTVNCGPGKDIAYIDPGDAAGGCETTLFVS